MAILNNKSNDDDLAYLRDLDAFLMQPSHPSRDTRVHGVEGIDVRWGRVLSAVWKVWKSSGRL